MAPTRATAHGSHTHHGPGGPEWTDSTRLQASQFVNPEDDAILRGLLKPRAIVGRHRGSAQGACLLDRGGWFGPVRCFLGSALLRSQCENGRRTNLSRGGDVLVLRNRKISKPITPIITCLLLDVLKYSVSPTLEDRGTLKQLLKHPVIYSTNFCAAARRSSRTNFWNPRILAVQRPLCGCAETLVDPQIVAFPMKLFQWAHTWGNGCPGLNHRSNHRA